jgi:hypothetical protein
MVSFSQSKQKVIWTHDKGKNTITNDQVFPDLLNIVAAHPANPDIKPRLLTEKDFDNKQKSIEEKLQSLTPPLLPVECPLARELGLPLTVFAYAEAKPGEPPSKGEPNMIASILTKRLREKTSRIIRGKALVAFTEPVPSLGMDLHLPILVKLLFFTGDLVKDTIGHVFGPALEEKLANTMLFFQMYGPGRHVVKQMTALLVAPNPGQPPQEVPVEALKQDFEMQQRRNQMAMRAQNMPNFMNLPYMRDGKFRKEIKDIVLRGWVPPTSVDGGDDEDGMTSGSLRKPAEKPNAEGEDEDEDDEDEGTLDFSDLNAS